MITKNFTQTKKIGEELALRLCSGQAKEILKNGVKKTAVVLGLQGDLGSGKTTFLQGFAKGLGIKEKILSPTFIIYKKFQIKKFENFYHFDCYRIKNSKEIIEMGFKEIVSNPKNIVAIEWSEKIKKFLPKSAVIIKFKFISEKTREIIVKIFNNSVNVV